MSGYMHYDPVSTETIRLRRCDLCHVTEEETGVHEVFVEHPYLCQATLLDLCEPCEAKDYDKAQALVADRHGTPIAEPVARPLEPDEAERRIEADLARWEQFGEVSA